MHNVVMFNFILLLVTGLGMIYFNVSAQVGDARGFLVSAHKVFGVLLMAVPLIIFVFGNKRIWLENIRVVLRFGMTDIKWFISQTLTPFLSNVNVPDADKFNAGQKAWISIAFLSTVSLMVTGIIIWQTESAILPLFIHTGVTILVTPALAGHMFMALINKDTRQGVTSIIDGEVDAEWATHHHKIWMDRMARERVMEQFRASDEKSEE